MVQDGIREDPTPTLSELVSFLQRDDVATFFATHPNQLTSPVFSPPSEWASWWHWAAGNDGDGDVHEGCERWLLVWRYYAAPHQQRKDPEFQAVPEPLRDLVGMARKLRLSRRARNLGPEANMRGSNSNGQSPKKAHEVERMTAYVSGLLSGLSKHHATPVQHVVDIGAGQAYLSRALRDHLRLKVLALDWSDVQSRGAEKKEQGKTRPPENPSTNSPSNFDHDESHADPPGSLVYKTVNITSNTLLSATTEWIGGGRDSSESRELDRTTLSHSSAVQSDAVPVLFVALHACGSLTLDILRAMVAQNRDVSGLIGWTPTASIIVGCCYNMLRPEDRVLKSDTSNELVLSPNHLQLAAQTPSQWGSSAQKLTETKLAIRKVAWRALLESLTTQEAQVGRDGETTAGSDGGKARLGRLNDAAYADWSRFLTTAQQKMGFRPVSSDVSRRNSALESQVSVFQVIRCLLGPVVESAILLSRLRWLQTELRHTGLAVELVNLFDQNTGSGRNVAIVVNRCSDCVE